MFILFKICNKFVIIFIIIIIMIINDQVNIIYIHNNKKIFLFIFLCYNNNFIHIYQFNN